MGLLGRDPDDKVFGEQIEQEGGEQDSEPVADEVAQRDREHCEQAAKQQVEQDDQKDVEIGGGDKDVVPKKQLIDGERCV